MDDKAPLDIVEDLKYGAKLMHYYAVSLGMPEIAKKIDFRVNYHPDSAHRGLYGGGQAFFNTARLEPGRNSILSAAHELSHAQRNALSELSTIGDNVEVSPDAGPTWLDEGTAVFLTDQAILEAGRFWSSEFIRKYHLNTSEAYLSASGSLGAIEAFNDFHSHSPSSYSYSMFAVELLASFAGQSSLMDYYESLEAGTTWPVVFQSTFGMSVDEFYDRFDEHVANGFPRLETPKFIDE